MVRSRFGLLGLCAVIFGVMAFGASSAQAEPTAEWMVNGANLPLNGSLLPEVQITELEENDGTLLTKVAGIKVEILCKGATLEEAVLKVEGSSLGRIRFSGCTIKLNGTLSNPCEPHTGAEKGIILTNLLKDLIVLHKLASGTLDTLDKFTPEVGETFVSIELGPECAIGTKMAVIGEFFVKDVQNEFGVEKKTHLIAEGPLTALWVISKTAEHVATIDGSAVLALAGAHVNLNWSGLPA